MKRENLGKMSSNLLVISKTSPEMKRKNVNVFYKTSGKVTLRTVSCPRICSLTGHGRLGKMSSNSNKNDPLFGTKSLLKRTTKKCKNVTISDKQLHAPFRNRKWLYRFVTQHSLIC